MGNKYIAIWKVLFPDKYDLDAFSEIFHKEIESWFTADIACCDACYEDYTKVWPGITSTSKFQESGTSLESFYSGSKLSAVYTKEEFLNLCHELPCPVCGAPLQQIIWPFSPWFDVTKGLPIDIAELGALSIRTPSLALRHPLAKEVLQEIQKNVASVPVSLVANKLFRARRLDTPCVKENFYPPPVAHCGEGRYNHAGHSVLYLASSAKVAHGETTSADESCLVATITLTERQKVLDLATDELPSNLLQAVTASALLSSPKNGEGWYKPEYAFSRFVADCAMDAGFTAIRYPSVADSTGYNLVVLTTKREWGDAVVIESMDQYHPKGKKAIGVFRRLQKRTSKLIFRLMTELKVCINLGKRIL